MSALMLSVLGFLPGLPKRGLRAMAGYFGKMLPEEKRSRVHVLATALIWCEVVELLVEEEGVEDTRSASRVGGDHKARQECTSPLPSPSPHTPRLAGCPWRLPHALKAR